MCLSSDNSVVVMRQAMTGSSTSAKVHMGREYYSGEEDSGGFRAVYAEVMKELREHFMKEKEPERVATDQDGETVFLVDWDDTVMATTFLGEEETRRGYLTLSSYARFKFLELDRLVVAVLRKASASGRVVVVTNAGEGWVQISAQRYMPMVSALLAEGKVRVVSARSLYYDQFPDTPLEWKVHAFHDELRQIQVPSTQSKLNLIVIGDSLSDQYAAHEVVTRLNSEAPGKDTLLKFVKLIDRPNLDQLKKQMSLVLLNIDRMVKYSQAFDICVAT